MGTPIFFIQSRPGLNGKTFKMYKFRTMTNKCDKNGKLLEDKYFGGIYFGGFFGEKYPPKFITSGYVFGTKSKKSL